MKLCLFCGTFNPIHDAHIKMAKFIKDKFSFDKILIIPAYKPPHKEFDLSMSKHRLNMVNLATQGIDGLETSDIEFESEENSYTFHTIQKLYERLDITDKINFIIGTDAFEKIETWFKTDELKKLVKFIVFKRADDINFENFEKLKEKGYDFSFVDMPFYDVSSTEIRNALKDNNLNNLPIDKKVLEYIKKNGLYKNENE